MEEKVCDIVLPVYNQLTYVKDCIDSILSTLEKSSYHLYIIDDFSDNFTHTFLKQVDTSYPQITLHRNLRNLGFLRSSNLGISLGSAPYVVLINSDVIVTPNWLSRLLKCAESDPQIASVNPLTNYASSISIPIAPGANFYGMDMVLAQHLPRNYPDVVTGVGFCILLRRSALEDVGLFDEIYGCGYCEESDLCMRLTTRGYRTVVADNVYVYHKGRASFKQERDVSYHKNWQIFSARWSEEYKQQFRAFLSANPLKPVRDLFQPTKQQWEPIQLMQEAKHVIHHHWHQRQWFCLAKEAVKGLRQLPNAKHDVVTPSFVAKVTRPRSLRVTYVLPGFNISGGIFSVIQLVNELILLGVEARIVAPSFNPQVDEWKFFTQPIIFHGLPELLNNFPESDIAIATFWTTAPWVTDIVKTGRVKTGVYFIQDYESWFYPESDPSKRAQVKATYELIPNKIVKSDWLARLLAQDGYEVTKIPLGMDLSLFYPREICKPKHPTVIAITRPRITRRGFSHTIEALQLVKEAIPEVEIILFGDEHLKVYNIPFEFRNEGIVLDQDKLAELYSIADVFLDGSEFQGFGRPALEAMACGTACVLTSLGGVTEYAVDKKNCLLVPPKQPKLFAKAITEILSDENLKSSLVENGFITAKGYCHKKEARETLDYFHKIAIQQN